jgi:hypothetical protein
MLKAQATALVTHFESALPRHQPAARPIGFAQAAQPKLLALICTKTFSGAYSSYYPFTVIRRLSSAPAVTVIQATGVTSITFQAR